MKIRVEELEGVELDRWVAKAEGHLFTYSCLDGLREVRTNDGAQFLIGYFAVDENCQGFYRDEDMYSPSTDWSHGGPIIEREKIMLEPVETWCAHLYTGDPAINYAVSQEGKTPLIAAMRCFVASKFGEEVEG